MNQLTESALSLSRFWRPSVLLHMGWISVFSLCGGNLAWAETATPDVVIAPPAQASETSAATATRSQQLKQKLQSATTARQLQPHTAKPPVRQLPSQPLSVKQEQPRINLPSVKPATAKSPRSLSGQSPQLRVKPRTSPATDYSGTHIDPTAYSIGATSTSPAPSAVVISERSTGCKAVLNQGQGLASKICGSKSQRSPRLAANRTKTPATNRTKTNRGVAVAAIAPVRVGPISISANGLSAADSNTKYNGKVHPAAKLGNLKTGALFPLTVPAPITSLFGWRLHPITGDLRFHTGTDLGAPLGAPVLAVESGNVAFADFWGGYGLTVVLDHNKFTQQTLYAHLSEAFVQPGTWVEQGTVIGRVGNTGNSTGPHLHFESRQLTKAGWVASDPGIQLESALAQLLKTLQTAKLPQQPGS